LRVKGIEKSNRKLMFHMTGVTLVCTSVGEDTVQTFFEPYIILKTSDMYRT
jgi:hypothetical protein